MTVANPVATALLGALIAIVACWIPGTLFFRLPILRREARFALPAEERVFWQVSLSLVWSVGIVLALGALSAYSLPRLLAINTGLAVLIVIVWRRGLRVAGAARLTATAVLPVALVGFALWRFLPAAEYIIGGKDPGVYVNEGISLHRTGTIFRRDAVVAAVPDAQKDLFFHDYPPTEYYGQRFMGVFLNDPATGEVIAQFPHFLPASIAIGYAIAGVRGATMTVVAWSIMGLLAVYFFGVRLAGRAPAFMATVVLSLNVLEAWYGKFPNAEVVMQTLVFAGLLAFSYAIRDDQRYFGWVTGLLGAALIFLRFDAYLAIAGFAGAAALVWIVERRAIGWGAGVLLSIASAIAWRYYSGPMRAYFWQYRENLPSIGTGLACVAGALAIVWLAGRVRKLIGPAIQAFAPPALVLAGLGFATYALFIRHPAGPLAPWDAFALRNYRDTYALWLGLGAGLLGFALVTWQRFWREPAFFLLVTAFSLFFFYKIRVQHEHFWIGRRFLPVILPGMLLLASAGALGVPEGAHKRKGWRVLAGTLLLAVIGWQYAARAAPVAAHVEYRGAIAQVQKLAARTTDRDLLIFESRDGSDMHVYALPLANAYGRNVLVLESEVPDRAKVVGFLRDALGRYERVLLVASGGIDMLSRTLIATPLAVAPVRLPEYATSDWDQYPAGPREKDLSYDVYQLTLGTNERHGFVLDVGNFDDLHVLRFQAKETTEDRTFRWTGPQSYIAVTGLAGDEKELTLVMHDGGRPSRAPPAAVELFFNDTPLGTIQVGSGFREYRVALPTELVRAVAGRDEPVQLKLVTNTWKPRDYLGGTDDRELGVMIDRVEIH